jgi:hypothetical protein
LQQCTPVKKQGCANLRTPVRLSRPSRNLERGIRFLGQFVQKLRGGASEALRTSPSRHFTPPFSHRLPKAPSCLKRDIAGGHDVLDLAIRPRNALTHVPLQFFSGPRQNQNIIVGHPSPFDPLARVISDKSLLIPDRFSVSRKNISSPVASFLVPQMLQKWPAPGLDDTRLS